MVQKLEAEMGITNGMLARPSAGPTSRAAVPFISDPSWKKAALANRRAQGPQTASGRRK